MKVFNAFRLGNWQWAVYLEGSTNAVAIVNYSHEVEAFLKENFKTFKINWIQ